MILCDDKTPSKNAIINSQTVGYPLDCDDKDKKSKSYVQI